MGKEIISKLEAENIFTKITLENDYYSEIQAFGNDDIYTPQLCIYQHYGTEDSPGELEVNVMYHLRGDLGKEEFLKIAKSIQEHTGVVVNVDTLQYMYDLHALESYHGATVIKSEDGSITVAQLYDGNGKDFKRGQLKVSRYI